MKFIKKKIVKRKRMGTYIITKALREIVQIRKNHNTI